MPSIFMLEGPNLSGQLIPIVNGPRPRIFSATPAGLGIASLSGSAANFWLGLGLGVAGTVAFTRWRAGSPVWSSSKPTDGLRGARRRRRRRR